MRLIGCTDATEQTSQIGVEVEAIQLRGLDRVAAAVWAAPALPGDVLEAYRPTREPLTGYTIADHPYLAESMPMRPVFEAFRKEVLALDPCVTEEFLKFYVAYKAETNFVDVVPQAKLSGCR